MSVCHQYLSLLGNPFSSHTAQSMDPARVLTIVAVSLSTVEVCARTKRKAGQHENVKRPGRHCPARCRRDRAQSTVWTGSRRLVSRSHKNVRPPAPGLNGTCEHALEPSKCAHKSSLTRDTVSTWRLAVQSETGPRDWRRLAPCSCSRKVLEKRKLVS